MICIALFLCLALSANPSLDSLVRAAFPNSKPECITYKENPQSLFSGVKFLTVDTSCLVVAPPSLDYPPVRIAVDSSNNIYRLYGFDSLEFNRLVDSRSLTVTPPVADSLARLFLDDAVLFDPYGYFYIQNLDSFVAMQVRFGEEGYTGGAKTASERALRTQLRKLQVSPSGDSIVYDSRSRHYRLRYYVWFESDGKLQHFEVSVTDRGECFLDRVTTLGYGVGNNRKWQE